MHRADIKKSFSILDLVYFRSCCIFWLFCCGCCRSFFRWPGGWGWKGSCMMLFVWSGSTLAQRTAMWESGIPMRWALFIWHKKSRCCWPLCPGLFPVWCDWDSVSVICTPVACGYCWSSPDVDQCHSSAMQNQETTVDVQCKIHILLTQLYLLLNSPNVKPDCDAYLRKLSIKRLFRIVFYAINGFPAWLPRRKKNSK